MSQVSKFLRDSGLESQARGMFLHYPLVEEIVVRFVDYVTPSLVSDGVNVGKAALEEGFASIKEGVDHQRFIAALCGSVRELAKIQISVPARDGLRHIWFYDTPLRQFMKQRGGKEIRVSRREEPWPEGTILTHLLANIANFPQIVGSINHDAIRATVLNGSKGK